MESEFKPGLRLHPLSWLFALTGYLRQLILPLAALLLFGARDNAALWGAVVLVPLLLGSLWRQWIYRYGFGPQGLVIHEGLFFRNVRQIEYGRIENIDSQRGVLHRLFGVAEVRIETSTGGDAEASIRVLGLDAIRAMRERIFTASRPAASEPAQATEATLLRLPPRELVRYGLIDNRGIIVVAALLGLLQQAGFFDYREPRFAALLNALPVSDFAALGVLVQVAMVAAALVGILLMLRVFSIVQALLTFFDFTLTGSERDLRIRYGLLTRVALTLRIPRIQSIHRTETVLHRLFKRVSLRMDLAGDTESTEQAKRADPSRTRWLAPLCTPQQAQQLVAAALPDIDWQRAVEWQPLAARAQARIFRQTIYVWTVLTLAPALWWLHYWAFLVLSAGLPLAWLRAHLYIKHTRWALTPDAIFFQHGWLTRRLSIAPRNRVQSVQLAQSPFDRRYGMASLSIDTAGAGARDHLTITLLDRQVAGQLLLVLHRADAA